MSVNMSSNILKNIPNSKIREYIAELSTQYANENGLNPQAVLERTSEIYAASGKPRVKQTPSFLSRLVKGFDKNRAHMNPFGKDKLYNIHSYQDLMDEMSHSFNFKNLGWFGHGKHGLLKGLAGKYGENYNTPGYTEHTTHSITQPLLEQYVSGSNTDLASIAGKVKDLMKNPTNPEYQSGQENTTASSDLNPLYNQQYNYNPEEQKGKVILRHPGEHTRVMSSPMRVQHGGVLNYLNY